MSASVKVARLRVNAFLFPVIRRPQLSAAHNFEPMSTGMVLDRSFKLYLDNFALMIGLSAILNVPLLVISLIFNVGAIQPTQISSAMFVAILIGSFLGLLAILIISPLIAGATSMAISEVYLGNPLSSGTVLAM